MMSTEHPITPPHELVEQWYKGWLNCRYIGLEGYIATQAARWGADQELETCCKWLSGTNGWGALADSLRAARRPKPPSLKEQALATLEAMEKLWESCGDNPTDIIRCALDALPDE